jgi:hypothetical protein
MTRQVYIAKEFHEDPSKQYRQVMVYCARDAASREMVFLPPSSRKKDLIDLVDCYQYQLVQDPKALTTIA